MNAFRASSLVLALLAAACGQSKEEKRVAHLKDLCRAAVGAPIHDLELGYDGLVISIAPPCATNSADFPPNDCPADVSVCIMGFDLPASSDQNVCKPSGCYFTCLVVAAEADLQGHENVADHSSPICGTEWVDGLSGPPFFNAPLWLPGVPYE